MRRFSMFGTAVVLILSISCSVPFTKAPDATFSKKISFSILQDYPKGTDLKEVEADFALARELGLTTWRGSFSWIDYEPTRGNYDFAWLHQFVDLAARNNISLRPYIGYTPEWAAKPGGEDKEFWNNPPARVNDWYAFVSKLASDMKTHPNIISYEMYNEENARMWWDGSAAEYTEVLKSGSEAVHAVRKDAQILFGGMTYPDLEWIRASCITFGSGKSFDILPFHAYPETWTPPDVKVENYLDNFSGGSFGGKFITLADSGCGRKPIWINEMGFATTPGKKTERDQANWWVRAMATFVADPRIEHLGIYQIKEPTAATPVIGESENYYLGITYHDGKKKLAFHTIKRLISLLDTGTLTVADKELAVEAIDGRISELYSHLFIRPDGRQVLFIWDKSGSPTLQVTLKRGGKSATEYALDGKGIPYNSFDGKILRNVKLAAGEVRMFEIEP